MAGMLVTHSSLGVDTYVVLTSKADRHRYSIMFCVALDILPVQASAVSCERVFSSSKETCAMRRSCLSPVLMEARMTGFFIGLGCETGRTSLDSRGQH